MFCMKGALFYQMEHIEQKSKAIEKVLKVMMAFGPDNKGIGTMELSRAVGLPKSTVSRIVNTLADYGFIMKNPQTKKFHLGWRIVNLGLAMTQYLNENIITIARPLIDELRDSIKETVTLTILYGKDVVTVYVANKPGPMGISLKLGRRLPFNTAASAKAIYSFLSPDLIEEKIREGLPSYTPDTITKPEKLKTQLKKIREKGFAFDNGEHTPGINALSVPIFNSLKEPIAAVCVVGLPFVIKWGVDLPVISKLKDISIKISEQCLGFFPHATDEDV